MKVIVQNLLSPARVLLPAALLLGCAAEPDVDEVDQSTLAGWVSAKMSNRRKKIIGDELKGRGIFMDVEGDRLMRDTHSSILGSSATVTTSTMKLTSTVAQANAMVIACTTM